MDSKQELKHLSILFVEDDDIAREMLKTLLERMSDTVHVGRNGREGLELYKQHRYDIVISDIKMPIMSGVEMAAEIRAFDKNAVIVLITAHKEPMLVVKAIELGVKRFVFKPVKAKELKEILFTIAKEINVEKELARKEEEIKEERILTEKILDTQNNIVIFSSKEDGLLKINRKFFDYFDYKDLEDFKQEHSCVCDLFLQELGLVFNLEDIEKIADEPADHGQKHLAKAVDKNGNTIVFSIAVEKVLLNNIEHFVITLNDITFEEEALEKARDVDRIKSEFFTNMSHEIRTPINGIIGFADLLEESVRQKELKSYANIIGSSAKSLLNIINDILDYSKIEEGKLTIEEIPCDIPREVESTVELFYAESLQKKITLLLRIDPFFPSCSLSDPLRIRQVLSNLISNSIKFTQENGKVIIDVKYLCSIEAECAQLFIGVSDTGIGIPEEKQQKIFEAFSQADTTTTREFGGTGLGLSISSRLVSLMGGELKLHSTVGEGSSFYFTLDLSECEESRMRIPVFKPRREQIAIISESPCTPLSHEMLLKNYLDIFGFHPICFYTEKSFLASREHYDLVFLFDSLTPALRSTLAAQGRKSILVSAYIDGESRSDVDEILHLPLYASKIYAAVSHVLDNKKAKNTREGSGGVKKQFRSRILVAEDNLVNQKLIAIILEKMGCDVSLASNGLEAVSAFKGGKFDMIFMDINMPVMDGMDATKEILRIETSRTMEHTPIIALTANIQKGDRERFISVGMDDYLPKPITQHMVEEAMGKYVDILPSESVETEKIEMPSDEIFDIESAVGSLGVSQMMILELASEFLENFEAAKEDFTTAIATADAVGGKALAHKFKGASGNLRMRGLHTLFKTLEEAFVRQSAGSDLFEQIVNQVAIINARLENVMNSNKKR